MKHIKKSSRLKNVNYEIRGPVLDEAGRMQQKGIDIIKLNIGNPAPYGFDAPAVILEEMAARLYQAQGYSDSGGVWEAREAIQEYCKFKGIEGMTADDIFTGNGVSELIIMSMQALLNDGDEVLIPAPDYPLWTSAVSLSGGKPVHYMCDEGSNWYPDIQDLKSKVTTKTRAIVVINPNNPTGALYPAYILEKIADVAREHELILFADEIYDRLVMDDKKHVSVAAIAPDLLTVTFNGLSKSHLATGFRSGWMCICGNKYAATDYVGGIKTLASMRLCSNVPAQLIIPVALKHRDATRSLYMPGGRIYEQREQIYRALNEIEGISAKKPEATFYIFPKIDIKRFNIKSDVKFSYDLLKEKHMLVVHGTGFNWPSPDHFRVVYLPCAEQLGEASGRLSDFLNTYRQQDNEIKDSFSA